MTGRIGAMAMDGTPISATDVARMQAEEELHAEWKRKAVRAVAASAADADDCRLLLSILGMDADVVAAARRSIVSGPAPKPVRRRAPKAA
jgi:hypothetical protein